MPRKKDNNLRGPMAAEERAERPRGKSMSPYHWDLEGTEKKGDGGKKRHGRALGKGVITPRGDGNGYL